MRGNLELHFEPNGDLWAFREDPSYFYQNESAPGGELFILENGDTLRVFDKYDQTELIWEGKVSLRECLPFTEEINGIWVQSKPEKIDESDWYHWFFEEYPAELDKDLDLFRI